MMLEIGVGSERVVVVEALVEQVNGALEVGDWEQVVALTALLYGEVVALGDVSLAELVQDMHWIAQDAVVHPLEAARRVQP